MTKEERAVERKAYRENIAEVNEWKRKAQARRAKMTLEKEAAYFDALAERLRKDGLIVLTPEQASQIRSGVNLVFPEQPAKTDKG
ncbi:hypothetical protein FACS1894200_08560 [Spirochaetia bacterium]|nr:hypothetical protein FACS1894200_08560 [Spirochaetia bacterium]